jgi:DNA-binding IscR family transcriptional regulator
VNQLQQEIIRLLIDQGTTYASPLNSREIGAMLQVTPSYIRVQLSQMVKSKRVQVRRGNGGGYFYK